MNSMASGKSENIKMSVEGEFYFFSKIFGFEAADVNVELKIYNLDEENVDTQFKA